MAARIFQSAILQMKDSVDRMIGVIDTKGTIIACSELQNIGKTWEDIIALLTMSNERMRYHDYTFKPIGAQGNRFEYAIFVQGEDKLAESICGVAAVAISNICNLYEEKNDKAAFIKSIILDNILPGDIYVKSLELHFEDNVPRVAFLIRQADKIDIAAIDILLDRFPDKQNDFIINVNEVDIALIKKVKPNVDIKELIKVAEGIEQLLNTELSLKAIVGIGTTVNQLKEVVRSYREAQVAIEIGRVFDAKKTIISFENLGVGRLIYQLPETLCRMFLSEVFRKGSIESLDEETLFTVQKFFENNLNVSETSRKLFVHRNTLVYRLEKIKKLTGLDLREFDHAIVFKVALMVKKYLESREAQE